MQNVVGWKLDKGFSDKHMLFCHSLFLCQVLLSPEILVVSFTVSMVYNSPSMLIRSAIKSDSISIFLAANKKKGGIMFPA